MFADAGVSASAIPFAMSGIASVTPPVPVDVAIPAPVRLNHVSSVKLVAPSPVLPVPIAGPKVTYWLEPLNCSAAPASNSEDAETLADETDAFADVSTALTA